MGAGILSPALFVMQEISLCGFRNVKKATVKNLIGV